MTLEETMERMELLGTRIKEGTASKLEAVEWLEFTTVTPSKRLQFNF